MFQRLRNLFFARAPFGPGSLAECIEPNLYSAVASRPGPESNHGKLSAQGPEAKDDSNVSEIMQMTLNPFQLTDRAILANSQTQEKKKKKTLKPFQANCNQIS